MLEKSRRRFYSIEVVREGFLLEFVLLAVVFLPVPVWLTDWLRAREKR